MRPHSKDISEQEFTAFQNGSQGIFRKIFDTYQQVLLRYAYSVCGKEDIASDAVQESFVQLYQNRSKVDGPSGIYPLLFVMTKRYLLRVFRRSIVEAKFKDELSSDWDEGSTATIDQLAGNDLRSLLLELVEQLPAKQKEIFQLNKFAGYSYEEISEQMGTSKNTVKNQLISASRKIRLSLHKLYAFIFLIYFFRQ
ncbi:RNA polymerase sigma factor [Sphingobacterium sp. SGR-19]|uniref:RNA polymerase sigma factor n=1 Tax=Sphingobacterium sp. SGR-19 TaxID=2710886 RepID=UPI0013EB0D97|nr:sigma-70 family RNA polymerase sigma factor [Sphingobacterium sp. SGR-19]NGM67064.1 sigma-70 family RNA polymerase sigma factor [Sphingobacterium sp. SGR-19]